MGRITIHPTSYGSIKVIGAAGHVHVGKYCSLAAGIQALMVGHNLHHVSTFPFNKLPGYPAAAKCKTHPVKYGVVKVGNDVWIGQGATILGGITVSNGSSIGSCAFVTKNVPPYSIVGGVPARVLGYRFPLYIVEKLLEINWWDWPHEKVIENAGLLCSGDIDKFIELHWRRGDGN